MQPLVRRSGRAWIRRNHTQRLFTACEKGDIAEMASQLLKAIRQKGLSLDITCSALIGACEKGDNIDEKALQQ